MMLIGVFAKGDRYTSDYVANFANVYVLDALKRVPGAGQAQVMGVADQAMRIWMNPDRMASLGITTTDIANAVQKQNALFGAGQIGQQPTAGAGRAHLPRRHAGAVHRAAAVREHHPQGEPGRQRDRAARRRRARGSRPAPVHRRVEAERHADDVPRRLPAARRERPHRVEGGPPDARGHEGAVPGGDRLRRRARHQRLRPAVDRGSDPHAVRGGRARRADRLPVPAEHPHDDHLHGRHLRVADHDAGRACSRSASRST